METSRETGTPVTKRHWIGIALVAAAFVAIALAGRDWRLIKYRNENRQIVRELGIFGYVLYDVWTVASSLSEKSAIEGVDLTPFSQFLDQRQIERGAPSRDSFQPKNVVLLQMESVEGFCLSAEHQGEPLMPNLQRIAKDGIEFSRTMDVTHSGRTVDAELLVLTSLIPIKGVPVFVNYDLKDVPSLPRVLRSKGYDTFSIHGYEGQFWNRKSSHQSLGYNETYFVDSFEDPERIGWGVSDHDTLSFAIEKISHSTGPYFAHIILLTHHHPYDHVSEANGLSLDMMESDYIESLRYVDREIGAFYDQLRASIEMENTILAIYGDHNSGITFPLTQYLGIQAPKPFYTVPLVVLGLSEESKVVDKLTGLQDLPVMLLDELGSEITNTFIGNTLDSIGEVISFDSRKYEWIGEQLISSELDVDVGRLTKVSILRAEELQR